jgi:CheY-like chemotaxis protein
LKPLRILIIEDDAERTERICSWLPDYVKPVVVTSAGKAMGLLNRDRGKVYAGIMMDHDLQEQIAAESDRHLSGTDVVESIMRNISKEVPIFIHSGNIQQGPAMASRLEKADYWVTRVPIFKLNKNILLKWIEDVRDWWEE